MAAAGGTSRNDSGRRYRRHERSTGLFSRSQNGHLTVVTECVYPSRDIAGLDEIVAKFVEAQGATPTLLASALPDPSVTAA